MAGHQANVEFESNNLAFSEASNKNQSQDSDIASSIEDSEGVTQPQTAVRGSDAAEYEDANRGRPTLDENTVDEADEILNNFSDNSDNNESAEDIAAEAEEIVSGFSGSKDSSSGSENGSSPREFAMGLGGSSSDDNNEGVLMHTMSSDDDGDIGLEELFENAAALEVTMETENSDQKELNENSNSKYSPPSLESGEFDSTGVESNSSLSCSTIEEEHTKNIEAEQTTSEEDQVSKAKSSAAVDAANTVALASVPLSAPRSYQPANQNVVATSVYTNSRVLMYDTDDEETGTSTPMPWFSAVPYSTGKWKKTEEGMSVVSDDISYGGGGAVVIKANYHIPYTPGNRNYSPPAPRRRGLQRMHWILIILGLLLLAVAAVLLGIYLVAADPQPGEIATAQPSVIVTAEDGTKGTIPPTIPDTLNDSGTESSTETTPPTTVTTIAEETVTTIPEETETVPPTTVTSVASNALDFEATQVVTGLKQGDNLGSVISMTQNGAYVATLSDSTTIPIRTFADFEGSWSALPRLPVTETPSSIATAVTQDGDLVVALSSDSQIEIYDFVDSNWVPRGEVIIRDAPQGILHTSLDLSSDASTLALGMVDAMGTTIGVYIYQFDDDNLNWGSPTEVDLMAHRDGTQRSIRPEEGTIRSLDVQLSGDGSVLSIAEWDVGSPQVIVQSFEMNYYSSWTQMGDPMEFPYGPVSMALSNYGHRLAVVAEHPGMGSVFEWDGKKWASLGSNALDGFLPGGSDVALARAGTRIIIGDAAVNTVSVYDLGADYAYYYNAEEWTAWVPTESLAGVEGSSFGASVAMDVTGSLLSVGAPSSGKNIGQVTLYGRSN